MKKLLSEFISLMIPIDEGETHSWLTIIGMISFIAFIVLVFALVT